MAEERQATGRESIGTRIKQVSQNFFMHIHASRIHEETLHPVTTLGLGVILASLFITQLITGMLLMIHYVPSVENAYYSVKEIIFYIPGGRVIRNIHRWAAHGMVFVTFLHLFRTFYKGAYYGSRRRNWVGMPPVSILLITVLKTSLTVLTSPGIALSGQAV